MMIKPGITELSRYVDSRYTLVSMAANRARMVSEEQNNAEVYDPKAEKPVTVAVNEIAKGKVGYVRSESARRAEIWEQEKAEAIIEYSEATAEENMEEVREENAEKAAAEAEENIEGDND